jgi:tripartite ATP-independent transporter DctP family solute receptor
MKKFRAIGLFLTLVMVFALSVGCSSGDSTSAASDDSSSSDSASSGETYVFKLANVSALGDERDMSLEKFAELVDEKSDGKMKVEVYSGGSLGSWRDTIEGLEPGIVQIVCESIGTLEAYSPSASIDAYPYLYRDFDHYQAVMQGDVGEELLNTVGEEGGFVIMGPSYRGARVITSKKKIESADDLAGLKIRAPGIQMYLKTWEYLGATPTPMDATEIYTALQQGTVDAQENPILFSYGNAYYDVTDYLVLSNHVMSTDVFIFNDDYFNGLPEDVQTILKEAATEAGNYRTQLVLDMEEDYINKFEEKGVEVISPDVQSFQDKLTTFGTEFPDLQDLVQEIQAVQ